MGPISSIFNDYFLSDAPSSGTQPPPQNTQLYRHRSPSLETMRTVGIRALKQNASALVAEAASGETVTITDRGRPVARMTAVPTAPLQSLIEDGRARAARRQIRDLPTPPVGPSLTVALNADRDDCR